MPSPGGCPFARLVGASHTYTLVAKAMFAPNAKVLI